MKGIVPIWALFLPILFAWDFAVAQLNHEVASLLRVKSHLRSFECRVHHVETTSGRHHSKLLVFRDSEQEPVLAFDPGGYNRLFQMFVMDLTGDEDPELVTFWQHGVYEQVVVFSLEADPRQILRATGRGGVFFESHDAKRVKVRIMGTSPATSEIETRVFEWCERKREFIHRETTVYPYQF
jgi:hypothetical protein